MKAAPGAVSTLADLKANRGGGIDVSTTAGSTTKNTDPGAANALIALKGNPTPERIAAFKKYYPNDIGMLKTIGLK